MEVANFCAAMDTLIDQDGTILYSPQTNKKYKGKVEIIKKQQKLNLVFLLYRKNNTKQVLLILK